MRKAILLAATLALLPGVTRASDPPPDDPAEELKSLKAEVKKLREELAAAQRPRKGTVLAETPVETPAGRGKGPAAPTPTPSVPQQAPPRPSQPAGTIVDVRGNVLAPNGDGTYRLVSGPGFGQPQSPCGPMGCPPLMGPRPMQFGGCGPMGCPPRPF